MMKIDDKNEKKSVGGVGRREFLKLSSLTGASALLAGAGVLAAPSPAKAALDGASKKTFSLFRKEHASIDAVHEIAADYKRMDQKNTIFSRGVWSSPIGEPEGLLQSWYAKWLGLVPNPMDGEPGFSPEAHALMLASWAGETTGAPLSAGGVRNKGPLNNWEIHANPTAPKRHKFANKSEAARIVKRASRYLGADIVGIAPFDERWVYEKWFDYADVIEGLSEGHVGEPIHEDAVFPFKPKSVISVAFEMDYDATMTPGYVQDAAAGLEYSHMAETTHKIATFLNHLGYKAIPCGNDTAMSIPIALQAGLGEMSRMGTMISEKYGSRIRLAKVFTDMEIDFDKPITFGVWEFCKKCKKCADACPGQAISVDDEPSMEPKTGSISSHPGVRKWYHNNEKCFGVWEKNGHCCGVCLAVCPYNKLDTWVHAVAKLAVGVPVGRDFARQMDDAFGYGEITPQNVEDFWAKED